jgi:hypothetical protein
MSEVDGANDAAGAHAGLTRTRRSARLAQALGRGPQDSLARRLLPLVALALLLGLAAALWWARTPPVARVAAPVVQARPIGLPKFIDPAAAAARAPAGAADGSWRKDVLGSARDLRAVIDSALASTDPQSRRHAATAWRACFPLFNAPQGQTRSVAAAMAAAMAGLPAAQRPQRAPALQDLHARCNSLLALRDDELAALGAIINRGMRDETLVPAGPAVLAAFKRGDSETARALLRQTLRARDPAALYSLMGLASQLSGERPDAAAIDLALLRVACDNGLNCERTSLAALVLCAGEGHCDGDLYERWSRRSGTVNEAAVEPWIALWRKALVDGEFPLALPAR